MGGGEESGSPQPHLHAEWQPFNPLTLNQRLRAQRPQDGCRHFSSSNYSTGGSCSGKKQKEQKAETGEMEGSRGVHSHGLSLVWGQRGGGSPSPSPTAGAFHSSPSFQSSATQEDPHLGWERPGAGQGREETEDLRQPRPWWYQRGGPLRP